MEIGRRVLMDQRRPAERLGRARESVPREGGDARM
jgi:hypothetical protein